MRQVRYEARPLDFDKALQTWGDRTEAKAWVQHRNNNPAQTPVRLVEVITIVSEREVIV